MSTDNSITPGRPIPGTPSNKVDTPFDPLRLCVYTTVALLGWLLGPFAVVWFSALGLIGYWKAHQAGLTRSRCVLGDVRIVLLYLFLIVGTALFFAARTLFGWLS